MAAVPPPLPTNPPDENKATDPALKVSRTDPSLIHQVTNLQTDNQELYQQRRELEQKLKDMEQEKEDLKAKMLKMQQDYAAGNRKEMAEFRENFMKEWMVIPPPTHPCHQT
jgi:hypothetical protein